MGNRISVAPKQPEPSSLKSVPSLQEQISILEKRKTHLHKLIEIHDQKARESTLQDEVDKYLEMKRTYENELKSIFRTLDRIEGIKNVS
jgi:chaperonin cofactor prefoldin